MLKKKNLLLHRELSLNYILKNIFVESTMLISFKDAFNCVFTVCIVLLEKIQKTNCAIKR